MGALLGARFGSAFGSSFWPLLGARFGRKMLVPLGYLKLLVHFWTLTRSGSASGSASGSSFWERFWEHVLGALLGELLGAHFSQFWELVLAGKCLYHWGI